ncbi:MAG: hypothetical protein K9I85_03970 [Saprospiraceae bacterium]|nr:hypothetical protein [Saprospiraceae bacterium]
MNPDPSAFHPQQIHHLRTDAHQAVRRYVEKHEAALRLLDRDEFYDILVIYLDALFECGEYELFINRVDEAIAMTVDRPVFGAREERMYHHLLFRKAAVCDRLGREEQCIYILTELLRLNPEHKLAIRFLIRCRNRQHRGARQSIRALSIGLFLSTVLVLMVETLWIRPFQMEELPWVMGLRNALFMAGWLVLLGGESFMLIQSTRTVHRFRDGLNKKKRSMKNSPVDQWR